MSTTQRKYTPKPKTYAKEVHDLVKHWLSLEIYTQPDETLEFTWADEICTIKYEDGFLLLILDNEERLRISAYGGWSNFLAGLYSVLSMAEDDYVRPADEFIFL